MGPGQTVAGRYRIVERIGRGGHGEVYRAQQLPLGRDVALKMLLPEAWAGDSPERFAREASLVQALDHPNTVRLFDFGVDDLGLPFMVFELLRGRTLEDEIAKGPLEPERVARIATQVLKALMEAHARGIVHRDIKPSNVFLVDFAGEPDFVKVLDFGVARRATGSATQPKITSDGQIVGTPSYMAPEQVKDEAIGPKTDLYALGLVIGEALSGKPLVEGATEAEIWMKQAAKAPVDIPARVLTSAFGPVVLRATKKDPAERPASAQEMLRAIEGAMAVGAGPTDPLAAPLAAPIAAPMAPSRVAVTPRSIVAAPPAPMPRASSWTRWAIGLVIFAGVLMVAMAARGYLEVVRATRAAKIATTPTPKRSSSPVPPPPMPPLAKMLAARGWVPVGPVQSHHYPGFEMTSFTFDQPNRPFFHVHIYDCEDEDFAIRREKFLLDYDPGKAVGRRGARIFIVDDGRNGEEQRIVLAQLLP